MTQQLKAIIERVKTPPMNFDFDPDRTILGTVLCLPEGNRRSIRPVKGAPLRGQAVLALDRPTRRLGDGYREMG
jgi:hypothetical protein